MRVGLGGAGVFFRKIAPVTDVLLINRRADERSDFPLPADVLMFLSLHRLPEFCQTAD